MTCCTSSGPNPDGRRLMPTDPRVDEWLLRWRDLRAAGPGIAPEALCAETPELLAELQRCVKAVEKMERWLGVTPAANGQVSPEPLGPVPLTLAETTTAPAAPAPGL